MDGAAPLTESAADGAGGRAGTHGRAMGFILVSVLLNNLSLGVFLPVFPSLVEGFTHGDAAAAAHELAKFGMVWALMQLSFSPLLGMLSDRFGRRPVLLISMFGFAIDYLLMAVAPSLGWLFVGRIISGITGASGAAASAYVADVTEPKDRARSYAHLAAATGAGLVLGPALGGLMGQISSRAPFWLSAGLALLNGLYGLFVLRESLPKNDRSAFCWTKANPFGSVGFLLRHPAVRVMALIYFLSQLAAFPLNSIMVLYVNYRFGWGPGDVGVMFTALGLASAAVQGLAAPAVSRRVGDRAVIAWGFAFAALGFAILGLAGDSLVFWLGLGVAVISGVANPSLLSLLSRAIGAQEQGQLQGVMSGLFGVSRIAGPLLFTPVFEWSIRQGRWLGVPGLSILAGSALFAAALLLSALAMRPRTALAA